MDHLPALLRCRPRKPKTSKAAPEATPMKMFFILSCSFCKAFIYSYGYTSWLNTNRNTFARIDLLNI